MGEEIKTKERKRPYYMTLDPGLKQKLELIANNSKPRKTLAQLIREVMGEYCNKMLESIPNIDAILEQIREATSDEHEEETEYDGEDMPE